jgi:hypothetical protein
VVTVNVYVPLIAGVEFSMGGGLRTEAVYPFGPDQLYVGGPAILFAVSVSVAPAQTGAGFALPLIEGTGAAGVLLISTDAVPAGLVHPFEVTVTEYAPDAALVTGEIEGFCNAEVNPPGPDQLYVAPAIAGVVRLSVLPEQTGELLLTLGIAGV